MTTAVTPGADALEFTGERYIPGVAGDIAFEHHHRYALCLGVVRGRDVLDIACGEGYGCAMLAGAARSVLGVDIDPATVEHAAGRYGGAAAPVRFLVGSCDAIPAPDASVDVVTSFETIEHHDRHEEMMREVRRVLRPGGVLVISSPNRAAYSDKSGFENPFHVKELYRAEFEDLLRRHFPYVALYGQRIGTASFVLPADAVGAAAGAAEAQFGWFGGEGATAVATRPRPLEGEPSYFIAVCADTPEALGGALSAAPVASVYAESAGEMAHWSDAVNEQMREMHAAAQEVAREAEEARRSLAEAQAEVGRLTYTVEWMRGSRFWKLRNLLARLSGRKAEEA